MLANLMRNKFILPLLATASMAHSAFGETLAQLESQDSTDNIATYRRTITSDSKDGAQVTIIVPAGVALQTVLEGLHPNATSNINLRSSTQGTDQQVKRRLFFGNGAEVVLEGSQFKYGPLWRTSSKCRQFLEATKYLKRGKTAKVDWSLGKDYDLPPGFHWKTVYDQLPSKPTGLSPSAQEEWTIKEYLRTFSTESYTILPGMPVNFNWRRYFKQNPILSDRYMKESKRSLTALPTPTDLMTPYWHKKMMSWFHRLVLVSLQGNDAGYSWLPGLPDNFSWLKFRNQNPSLVNRFMQEQVENVELRRRLEEEIQTVPTLRNYFVTEVVAKLEKKGGEIERLASQLAPQFLGVRVQLGKVQDAGEHDKQYPRLLEKLKQDVIDALKQEPIHLRPYLFETPEILPLLQRCGSWNEQDLLAERAEWIQRIAIKSLAGEEAGYSWLPDLPRGFNWKHFLAQNPSLATRFISEQRKASHLVDSRDLDSQGNLTSPALRAKFANWLQRIAQLSLIDKEGPYAILEGLPTHFNWHQFRSLNPRLTLEFKQKMSRYSSVRGKNPLQNDAFSSENWVAHFNLWVQRQALKSVRGNRPFSWLSGVPEDFNWQKALTRPVEQRYRREQLKRTQEAKGRDEDVSDPSQFLTEEDFLPNGTLIPRDRVWLGKRALWVQMIKRNKEI